MNPTCDTVGILGPVVGMVASHQAMEAIKILSGHKEAVDRHLLSFDAWSGRLARLNVQKAYEQGDCPCCKGGRFEWLEGKVASRTVTLCGRNAVQIYPSKAGRDRSGGPGRQAASGGPSGAEVQPAAAEGLVDDYEITVFADGRALIKGTNKPEEARAVYARYIGG